MRKQNDPVTAEELRCNADNRKRVAQLRMLLGYLERRAGQMELEWPDGETIKDNPHYQNIRGQAVAIRWAIGWIERTWLTIPSGEAAE